MADHRWCETGTLKSWCLDCDVEARWSNGRWECVNPMDALGCFDGARRGYPFVTAHAPFWMPDDPDRAPTSNSLDCD